MATRLLRWVFLVAGGCMIGAGLVLIGQLVFADHMRARVRDTFFLWRGIGQVSFIFQDDETKLALWLNEIDPAVLAHSRHVAWVLITLGTMLALVAPWMRCAADGRRSRA
ncbi:MAG TPA: hypothetical protein VK081_07370 [Planctomycetota bacterium]|nr:hypothetical protein [Planctomycetota bacterium]